MTTRTQGRHRSSGSARAAAPIAIIDGSGMTGAVAKTGAVLAVSTGLLASIGLQADATPARQAMALDTPTTSLPAVADSQAASVLPAALSTGASVAPAYGVLGFQAKPKPKPPVLAVREAGAPAAREASSTSDASTRSVQAEAPAIKAGAPGSAEFGATVLEIAARYQGVPYLYGGTDPSSGLDCSAYTQLVFRQVGISLARTSDQQRGAVRFISRSEAQPGDLVFFPGHVGIYAGNGMMWHSPKPGQSVKKAEVYSSSAQYGRVLS
ncbi:MAG: C40 family peptidase [Actinomycetota bacterium]